MEIVVTRPSVETASCAHCNADFQRRRKDQKYCSAKCRKDAHQKKNRTIHPQNSIFSPTKRRTNLEFFDKAKRLAEEMYSLPPSERLGFVKEIIDAARGGDTALRHILTNRMLLKPDRNEKWLFHLGRPSSYFTIAEAADRYCKKFWGCGVVYVVKGNVPEPCTGEVIETEKVVTIIKSTLAWLQNVVTINNSTLAWPQNVVTMNINRPPEEPRAA